MMTHVDPSDWPLSNTLSVDLTELHDSVLLQVDNVAPDDQGRQPE